MARLDPSARAKLPDRAFAYIDSRGQRRLPIHDPAHVRNALARFGQVHVFNSLYTATGDNACIEVGVSVNMLIENNVFLNVSDPIDTLDYSNAASIGVGRGNIFMNICGMFVSKGSTAFTPPYPYNLDGGDVIQAEIMSGAGVK